MKKNILKVILLLALVSMINACGGGADLKYSKGVEILKTGSIGLIDEIQDSNNLPLKHYKLYLDKSGKVIKQEYIQTGKVKRATKFKYDKSGKLTKSSHYSRGEYNGISEFEYDDSGSLVKEIVFNENHKKMFEKKF